MIPETPGVVLRPIEASDAAALANFPCRDYRQPWTDIIEEMIQVHLVGAIASGGTSALGLWVGAELCGVAAWRIDRSRPVLCRSILLAVRSGHQRKGYARQLKEVMMTEARQAGASAVVSEVHWDNNAMIELNVALGGNVEQIPGDTDYCRCILRL